MNMGSDNVIVVQINGDITNYLQAAKQVEKSTKELQSGATKDYAGMSDAAKGMSSKLVGYAKTLGSALVTGTYGMKTFVDSGSQLQSLRASFESLTGSVNETNKVMSTLYEFGKKTAFSNESIQMTAKTFLASGVAANDLMGIMQNVGDVAGATGADLQGIAMPISQAIAAGKLQTQDWYQILNQGAGGLKEYIVQALGAGHSTQTFADDLSKGAVTADVLKRALDLANDSGNMAFEGAIKQSKTFDGRMSNLQESITNVGLKILGVDAATGQVNPGGIFDQLSKAVQSATDWLDKNQDKIMGVVDAVKSNFVPAVKALGSAIAAGFVASKIASFFSAMQTGVSVFKALSIALTGSPFGLIVMAIGAVVTALVFLQAKFNIFGQLFNAVGTAFNVVWSGIQAGLNAAIGFIGGIISGIWGVVQPIFNLIGSAISTYINIWKTTIMVIIIVVTNVVQGIMNVVAPIFNFIGGIVSGVWNTIVSVITPVANFFGNVFSGAMNAIRNIFGGIGGFFSGVWNDITGVFRSAAGWFGGIFNGVVNTIRNIFSGVINIVKSPINVIIDGVNTVIGGLNKLKVPDWVPDVGGKGLNIPKVPRLAMGGIIDSPTIGLIGEAGREAVMPLENNLGWLDELASKLDDRIDRGGNGGGNTITQNNTIQNNIDMDRANRDLFRMMRRQPV